MEATYNAAEEEAAEALPTRVKIAGQEYRRNRKTPCEVATSNGKIRLRRDDQSCEPGQPGIAPLEHRLGIVAGAATPALADEVPAAGGPAAASRRGRSSSSVTALSWRTPRSAKSWRRWPSGAAPRGRGGIPAPGTGKLPRNPRKTRLTRPWDCVARCRCVLAGKRRAALGESALPPWRAAGGPCTWDRCQRDREPHGAAHDAARRDAEVAWPSFRVLARHLMPALIRRITTANRLAWISIPAPARN